MTFIGETNTFYENFREFGTTSSPIDEAMQRFVNAEEADDIQALRSAFNDLREAGLFHEIEAPTPIITATTYPEDRSYID